MRTVVAPPASEAELSERANALAGRSLAWVADQRGIEVPANLKRDKGWIGQLLESVLERPREVVHNRTFPSWVSG